MRLFEVAKLKESMTMWIPSAPSEEKDVECWVCDGKKIDGYQNPKTGKYYTVGEESVEERLVKWDKKLEALEEKIKQLDSRWITLKSFYKANIENHPDLKPKFVEQFGETRDKYRQTRKSMWTRKARIKKKAELIQQLETIPCRYCKGKGTTEEHVSAAPEMNLSNTNAHNLMLALGYEVNSGYTIKPEDVPAIKRRIMQLQNSDELEDYTMKGGVSQKDFGMVRDKDPETGLDRISHKKGPTMIGPNIDVAYLNDKFQRMMPILDYAQKHNQEIHFA